MEVVAVEVVKVMVVGDGGCDGNWRCVTVVVE